MNTKLQKNFLINWIIFFWILLLFLWWYIFYKIFFDWHIYKNVSKNIDYIIEFDLKNFDKFWGFLWKNQPFFTSYLDEMNFKKWAIIFYQWKKIDALLTKSEKNSIKFLKKISIWKEKKVIKKNNFLISENSPAPFCQQNQQNLFCSKDKKILQNFINDIKNWEILNDEKNFLKVKNNLTIFWNFIFWYANLQNWDFFPLISEKFKSWWFTFWQDWDEIKWIFYWFSKKIFYEKTKNLNFQKKEKFNLKFNPKNTFAIFYWKNFQKKLEKNFEILEEKNPQIAKIWREIFDEKNFEINLLLQKQFWEKIFLEEKNNWDLFILKEKWEKIFNEQKNFKKSKFSLQQADLNQFLPKNIFSEEKIFLNLEKIQKTLWKNFFWKFKFFWAVSKKFDDWIQIKILIKK